MDQRTGEAPAYYRGHEGISSGAPAQAEELAKIDAELKSGKGGKLNGSAPKVLMFNGAALTIVALFFLIRGHGLKDV